MAESILQATYDVNDLGDIIRVLSDAPAEAVVQVAQDNGTYLGNGLEGVHSYRGYYVEMAISVCRADECQKVEDTIKELDAGVSGIYQGYKGGDFEYDYGTPVWVADYGNIGNLIHEVKIQDNLVTLVTYSDKEF
jgi:hypothetical protein